MTVDTLVDKGRDRVVVGERVAAWFGPAGTTDDMEHVAEMLEYALTQLCSRYPGCEFQYDDEVVKGVPPAGDYVGGEEYWCLFGTVTKGNVV